MTDVTVNPDLSPQNQPGPERTPDGTIKDSSPTPTPAPAAAGTTNAEGTSFITSKPEATPESPPKPEDKGTPAPAPQAAPETYTDFKLPDGVKLDEGTLKEATTIFKELGVSQEGAQRLVDMYVKNGLSAAEAPYKAWADMQKTWLSDISDRFGSKAETTRTEIGKAIDTLPPSLSKAFRTALDLTGAGSHPDIVEGLSILLKGHAEGGSVRQGNISPEANKPPGTPARPSAAEAMYPHLIPNRS